MQQVLKLEPLRQAVVSLKTALAQPKDEFVRDAVIQRFEYTFELAWKALKRYLKWYSGIEEYNIKNLFREAAKEKLIGSVENWFVYHKARNLTSHTYDEATAEETYLIAERFAQDVTVLLNHLEQAIDSTNQT